MIKTYIYIILVLVVIGGYFITKRIAYEQCMSQNAISQYDRYIKIQTDIVTKKRKIDEETYSTGVADIRDRLRSKYTIRD